MSTMHGAILALLLALSLPLHSQAASITICPFVVGAPCAAGDTRISVDDLATLTGSDPNRAQFQIVLDTEGLTFEGYFLGVDIGGGTDVGAIDLLHQTLSGFVPDAFADLAIDDSARTIRNVNQVKFSGAGLDPGVYLLDTFSFRFDPDVTRTGRSVAIQPGLFGEVLGLEGGSCPNGLEGDAACTVALHGTTIIPEPGTVALVMIGVGGLLSLRRRVR